ncbi:MAG: EI24 domain-containing protein [Campylobacterota bacterium]|nr:EI24 domain-containing protein [Campylobacterota bacterium]
MKILAQSVKDFFTPQILKLAFLPFVISMLIMYAIFFFLADISISHLQDSALHVEQSSLHVDANGNTHTEQSSETYSGSSIVDFLMTHAATSWIITFLVYTLGSFVILLLSIVVAVVAIGFLTPPILKVIHTYHYQDIEFIGFGNIAEIGWHFVKSFFIMLLLLILLIPLYFIPLLNMVAFNIPFYYFFHKLMTFDVGSTIATKQEYSVIRYQKANSMRFKTLLLYLVSLIPFAILFASAFYVIYLGHSYFQEVRRLRAEA